MAKDPRDVWWDEEMDRIHQTGLMVRRMGLVKGYVDPPALDSDGSLADPTENLDPLSDHWITVKGQHILIPQGVDKDTAIKAHFDRLKVGKEAKTEEPPKTPESRSESKHEEHGHKKHGHGPGEHLAHLGHEIHTAHESHEVVEGFQGGHEAHEAAHAVHEAAGHAADAHEVASHVHEAAHEALGHAHEAVHEGINLDAEYGHLAHPSGLDASAIVARHLYGPALKATSAIIKGVGDKVGCGQPCITAANAVAKFHDGCAAFGHGIVKGLKSRYGAETAGAILMAGAVSAHSVMSFAHLHGPLAKLIPAPHLIGAIPYAAVAEMGLHLKVVGEKSMHGPTLPGMKGPTQRAVLNRVFGKAGATLHAIRTIIGKPFSAASTYAGGKGAKLTGKASRTLAKALEKSSLSKSLLRNAENNLTLSPEEIEAVAKFVQKLIEKNARKLLEKYGDELSAAQGKDKE